MKVTLTHDGKSVELDLTAEQMTALGLKEEKKKTGYERVVVSCAGNPIFFEHYYTTSPENWTLEYTDHGHDRDNQIYHGANYYSNEDLARANARADTLMRRLRRFAAENGGIPSVGDWGSLENKYYICYHYPTFGTLNSGLKVEPNIYTRQPGSVYFNSIITAKKAIELYHDELIWYFTEYEAMLR